MKPDNSLTVLFLLHVHFSAANLPTTYPIHVVYRVIANNL